MSGVAHIDGFEVFPRVLSLEDVEVLYRAGLGADTAVTHVDGVPWHEAPIPRRRHRCKAQTTGVIRGRLIWRCACGAVRFEGIAMWGRRNERRRKEGKS